MNIKWNKKYLTIGIYAFLVLAAAILFFRLTENTNIESLKFKSISGMLTPVIISFVIAYLVNLLLVFFEERVLNIGKLKSLRADSKRGIALLLSYLVFIAIIVGFSFMLLPRLVDSMQALTKTIPANVTSTSIWVQEFIRNRNLDVEIQKYLTNQWQSLVAWLNNFLTGTLPVLGNFLLSTLTNLVNFFIGFILSIYFLLRKEHYAGIMNKMLFAYLPIAAAERINEVAHKMNHIMKQYIKGQLLVSFILSVFFFAVMILMKTPYPLLLTFILFITNLIPVIGPWIGSIPVVLLIFLADPVKGLWFILVILIGQQLEGNVISPRVQGQQLGVSAFWIMLTLIVANHFFGLPGMVVGLPVFVLLYSLTRDRANLRLKKRGLSTDTDEYFDMAGKPLPTVVDSVPIQPTDRREDFDSN